MARFRFPLDPLLEARRRTEQRHQLAVAELDRKRLELEDSLRQQQAFITEGKQTLRDRLVGQVDIAGLRVHAACTIDLTRRAERIVVELAGIHERLEKARGELREAVKQRRSLQRLRELRFEQWKQRLRKAEEAALDELAVAAAARGSEATMPPGRNLSDCGSCHCR